MRQRRTADNTDSADFLFLIRAIRAICGQFLRSQRIQKKLRTADNTDHADIFHFPSVLSALSAVLLLRSFTTRFPIQLGFLKIQEQRNLQTSDVQIPEHLRHMAVIESDRHFWVRNDLAIHDEVGN